MIGSVGSQSARPWGPQHFLEASLSAEFPENAGRVTNARAQYNHSKVKRIVVEKLHKFIHQIFYLFMYLHDLISE